MPTFPLEYVGTQDEFCILLDERSRKTQETVKTDEKRRYHILKAEGLTGDAAACLLRIDAAEALLKADKDLRNTHAGNVKTVVVEHREPTREDRKKIREALTEEDGGVMKARELVYDLLAPKVASGWDGPLPLKFDALIEDHLLAAVQCDLTEDLRFFTLASRSASSGKGT